MFRIRSISRSAAALGLVALVTACNDDTQRVFGPPLSGTDPLFARYVALGNSITAGYQSGGINDSTQRRSYAVLVSQQMQTAFTYPQLAGRGCAPPIINFLTQARFGGAASTGATCDLRTPSFSSFLNNVAVPGSLAADLTVAARTTSVTPNVPSPHVHATLFLGGKSQVQKALENDPTFASIWIGNNDILLSAVAGVLFPLPTVSIGVTPPATFTAQLDAAIAELQAGAPNLEGILIGVGNVVNVPALFPTDSLRNNATFRGQFDAAAGRVAASTDPFKAAALVIDANCATNTTTRVSFLLAGQILAFRNDTNPTGQPPKAPTARRGHPPQISCVQTIPGDPTFPIGEVFMLSAAEQATLAATAGAYNTYISGKAASLNWAYFDPNTLLDSLRTAGAVPARPNLTAPAAATQPFGAFFSLDGFHPNTLAHRHTTNHVINAINATYGTSLARIVP